uniref:Uncharacterized protein n=1 Tax=Anguilla anguilla TaxID=7936 RepID=A0A0E9TZA9_ANGAN
MIEKMGGTLFFLLFCKVNAVKRILTLWIENLQRFMISHEGF